MQNYVIKLINLDVLVYNIFFIRILYNLMLQQQYDYHLVIYNYLHYFVSLYLN